MLDNSNVNAKGNSAASAVLATVVSHLGGANTSAATVSVTEVKTRWGEVVKRARRKPVAITRNGKPQAVLISAAKYARLMEEMYERIEHEKDVQSILDADPKDAIPYEEIRANLKRRGRL